MIITLSSSKLSDWKCLQEKEELEKAQELHASFNYFSDFPQCLTLRLSSLRCLALNCNNLTSIPCLEGMTSLTELNLANNRIRKIENLHHLPCLEELNLRSNKITVLENITATLQWFSVSGNEVCSFCWDSLPQLPHLRFLGIYCNQLENFQEVLRFLSLTPALTELFVGCNPFTGFQPISIELQHLLNFSHLQLSTLRSQVTDLQQQQHTDGLSKKMSRLLQAVQIQHQIKKLCNQVEKIDGDSSCVAASVRTQHGTN